MSSNRIFFSYFHCFFFQICVVCFHIRAYLFSHVFVFLCFIFFPFWFCMFYFVSNAHLYFTKISKPYWMWYHIKRNYVRQDSNHQRIKQFFAMKLLLVVQWINEFFPDPCQLFLWNLAEKPIEHDWTNPHMTINSWQLPKQMQSNEK